MSAALAGRRPRRTRNGRRGGWPGGTATTLCGWRSGWASSIVRRRRPRRIAALTRRTPALLRGRRLGWTTALLWRRLWRAIALLRRPRPMSMPSAGWPRRRWRRGRRGRRPVPTGWRTVTARRRWRTVRRRRMIRPAATVAVPRASAIVMVPVGANRKRNERQADRRPVSHDGHIAALIRIGQIAAIDPPTRLRDRHVTPCVAAHAAVDGHRLSSRQLRDDRVVLRGSRVQVDRLIRVGLRLRRRRTRCDRQRHCPHDSYASNPHSHDCSPYRLADMFVKRAANCVPDRHLSSIDAAGMRRIPEQRMQHPPCIRPVGRTA